MKKIIILIFLSIITSCDITEKFNDNHNKLLAKNFSIEGNSIYFGESKFKFEKTDKLNQTALEYSKQENYKEARKNLLKALEFEPLNPILYNNLGNIEKLSLNGSIAKQYFEKSLKVSDSTYLIAALNLGVLHSSSGYFEKSKKLFQNIILSSDNNLLIAPSNLELTKLYIDTGNCEQANKTFKIAEKILDNLNVLKETKYNLKKYNLDYCKK